MCIRDRSWCNDILQFTYLLERCGVLVVLLLSAVIAGMGERRFLASTTTTVNLSALGRYDRENIKSPMCNVCIQIHTYMA